MRQVLEWNPQGKIKTGRSKEMFLNQPKTECIREVLFQPNASVGAKRIKDVSNLIVEV